MTTKPAFNTDELDGMMSLISLQLDNFASIKGFIKSNNLNTGTLFLPQTLAIVDNQFTHDPDLLYQCYEFIDMIGLFSVSVYGAQDKYFNSMVDLIISNRTVVDFQLTLSETSNTHVVYDDPTSLKNLLMSNKPLVGVYIYILMLTITYTRNL